jgi:hypothetical protein
MLAEKGYEPIPYDHTTLRIFRAGFLFEEFLLNTLDKKGLLLRRQEKVEYRGIKGTLDATIELNSEEVLFDCKSCKTDKFKYLDQNGIGDNYKFQLGFYHRALLKRERLSSIARVFYIEKDNMMIKEMPLVCNEELYRKVDQKIDLVNFWRPKKELPPEKEVIDWECFSVSKKYKKCKVWCQYYKYCPKIIEAYEKQVKEFGGENA